MVGSKMVRNCSQSIEANGEVVRSSSLQRLRTSSGDRFLRCTTSVDEEEAAAAAISTSGTSMRRFWSSLMEACTRLWLPRRASALPISTSESPSASGTLGFISPTAFSGSTSCMRIWSNACELSFAFGSFSSSSSIAARSDSSWSAFSSSWTPMACCWFAAGSVVSAKASMPSVGSAMWRPCSAPVFFSSDAAGSLSPPSSPLSKTTFCSFLSSGFSGPTSSG
mmetsp:Transcript_55084/g.117549  ORF Transcript_55084/g.117549 Transcript_55084/m.117549 type:complete len:223 (+) Transcript_55084:359-1027(+)